MLLLKEREKEIVKYQNEIISELELDYFLSEVVRGNIEIEKVLPVREYIPKIVGDSNSGRWIIKFVKYKSKPSLRERLAASHHLYIRMGSYKYVKRKDIMLTTI